MRFAEKLTALVLAIAFTVVLLPVRSKAATLTVKLSVDTLMEEGSVDVDITVHNDSQYPMTDIVIEAGGKRYSLGGASIAAGGSQPFTITDFFISESQIGKNIDFVMTWQENGKPQSTTASVFVHDGRTGAPSPSPTEALEPEYVEFTCSCDNPAVEKGDKAIITYTVVNNSSHKITDVTVTDSGVSSKAVFSGKTVDAGATYQYNYEYTMGDENITTSPILSYNGANGVQSVRGDSITIEIVAVDLEVNIVQCDPTEKGTEFIVKITNNGNKPIGSVRVYDKDGDVLEHAFDLGVGEKREFSYVYKPESKVDVSFTVTGTLATGEAYKFESETYTVWKYTDPEAIGLEFNVEVAEAIDEDGYVTLDFTVKNTGTVDMRDLVIDEETAGRVGVFSDLAGGGSDSISLTLFAGENPEDMTFTLTANAPTGEPFEYTVTVSAQSISLGGKADEVQRADEITIDVGSAVSGVMQKILIVLFILVGVTGVAFIVIAVFERQRAATLKNEDK